MGDSQSSVARLGLASGGSPAVGPPDGLGGMLAARRPATLGTLRGGGPPPGGRCTSRCSRPDTPTPARGIRGRARPSSRGARRQSARGDTRGGPERSPTSAAGGTGNATPPGRPAGVAVGAGVHLGPGALGSGPSLAGRPRGRHLGRAGPGLRDVLGPRRGSVPPPSVAGDAPPTRRARASPAAGGAAVAAPHSSRALLAGGSQCPLQGARSARGRLCAGLRARPFFAARARMTLQLQGLALHLHEALLHRLRTLARMRPGGGTRFLMTHFPQLPRGGPALLPYAHRPRREHVPGVAGAEESALGGKARAEGWWGPGARNMARPRAAAACSWAGESAGVAAQGTRDTRHRDGHPHPATTGPRPASAGTSGPPGGGKRALGMAGAGQTGVRSAASAREALTARPEAGAAASPAGTLARP